MPARSGSEPTRPVKALALALGVALPLVELGNIALVADRTTAAGAAACTALFLPLHVWHLRFGLRGLKPPRAGWTLTAMVVAHLAGAAIAGAAWALMLASLASSVLIVVDVPWAALMLGAIAVGAYGLGEAGSSAATGMSGAYVIASVTFRSATLFVLVWFSAAVCQLDQARSSIAAAAAAGERRRADDDLAAFAASTVATMVEHARRARILIARDARPAAAAVLNELAEASRQALARVRLLAHRLREAAAPSAASDALALTGAGPASPVERALADARHSRRVLVAQHLPMICFLVAVAATGLGRPGFPTLPPLVALAAGSALGALQLHVSLAASDRRSGRHGRGLLAAAWVLGLAPAVAYGYGWSPAAWFVAAIGMLVLRTGAARLVAFLLPIALWAANDLRLGSDAGATSSELALTGAYVVTIGLAGATGLVAAVRLAPVVDGLVAARIAQATAAGEAERRRISRDLHDLLGQTLSAVTLKAELARRLLAADPEAARREVESVIDVATGLAGQVDAVTEGAGTPSLAGELRSAASLLHSAGARVDVRLRDVGDLPAPIDALLAWSMREAVTNVLRHSRPRHCSISVERGHDVVRLELVNDGVARAAGPRGHGLANLGERVRTAAGSLRAFEAPDGRFHLQAEVPAGVPARMPEHVP